MTTRILGIALLGRMILGSDREVGGGMIEAMERTDRRVVPTWHPWEALPLGLTALVGSYLALIGLTAAFGGQGGVVNVVSGIVSGALLAGLTLGWVAVAYRGSLPALGLRSRRPAVDLAMGSWIGAALYLFVVFVLGPLVILLWRLVAGSPPDPIDQGLLTFDPTGVELVLGMFAAVVAAPIGEEIFFRGFLFGSLRVRLGFPRAATISSAAFALVHAIPLLIILMFFVGLGLAALYERRGSLVAPMGAHALFNIIGYTLLVMERV